MRISRIIIKKSGPLNNLDFRFSPVTLIEGDNERGKTSLVNWISRGIFDSPDELSQNAEWSQQIGGSHNVQIQSQPFPSYFDAQKMKNLLFIRENDLTYKSKSSVENSPEYWDNEINRIFYGDDNLSNTLERNFEQTIGLRSGSKPLWLADLYEKLMILRSRIDAVRPDIQNFYVQLQELQELNYRLSEIEHLEQDIHHKEEKFFVMEKINLGNHYLAHLDRSRNLDDKKKELHALNLKQNKYIQEISMREESLQQLDDKIGRLHTEVESAEDEVSTLKSASSEIFYPSVGSSVFQAILGSSMLFVGLFFAFQSIKNSDLGFVKLLSILFFMTGSILIIVLWIKSASMEDFDSGEDEDFFQEQYLKKSKKKFLRKFDQLEDLKRRYRLMREELIHLKKTVDDANFLKKKIEYECESLDGDSDLLALEEQIFKEFQTLDAKTIARFIRKIESTISDRKAEISFEKVHNLRAERMQIQENKKRYSQDYDRMYDTIWRIIQPAIDALKTALDHNMVLQFYPEIQELVLGEEFTLFEELSEKVDTILERVSQEKNKSEKLMKSFELLQASNQSILLNTLHSPFFDYIVQNIFGGKYKNFRIEFEKGNRACIFAETGHKEFFPLESLSQSSCIQFWCALRLSIAKTLLGDDLGVILLDNPFNGFDTIRKQIFVELLNAFVHKGWQVICTLRDDDHMKEMFQSMFGTSLQILDLNKSSS